ncbi:hypothetical protein D3C86_1226620 [compost metagenome]
MQPELPVEKLVLARIVPLAEPPEPVAALGDVDLLLGLRKARVLRVGRQGLTGLEKVVPSPILGGVANPGREVRVDPRARMQVVQGPAWFMRAQVLPDRHHGEFGIVGDQFVEGIQEIGPVAGVILPAVLAIEGDRDQMGFVLGQAGVNGLQAIVEVAGRLLRRHARVREADEIRKHDVPEDHGDALAVRLRPVGLVEGRGILKLPSAVAPQLGAQRMPENSLVAHDPGDPLIGHQLHDGRAHGLLRGPHAARAVPEVLREVIEALLDLRAGILGMLVAMLG